MFRHANAAGFFFPAILIAVFSAFDLAAEPVQVGSKERIDLLAWVEYRTETPDLVHKTPEEISRLEGWKTSGGRELDFGFITHAMWFKVVLNTASPGRYVLMVDAASSDLKVFQLGRQANSIDLGLDSRGLPHVIRYRRPAVELDLPAGETQILLRLQNEQVSRMAPVLFTARAFHDFRTTETLIYGAFFGAIIAISMYNFFVFLSTRETAYGIYVFYALMAGAYTAVFQGFHIVLFPSWGHFWLVHSVPVFTGLVGVGMNLFARSFLQTGVHAPLMHRVHLVLAALSLVIASAGILPVFTLHPLLLSIAIVASISVIAMLFSGILVWKRGYAPARYYVLAISLFALAALASSLRLIGVLEHHFAIQHGVQAALLAEMILLSLALSDRINLLKHSLERNLRDLAAAHELVATSEKKYRVLVEDTSDLIFALDAAGTILSVNHASARILGLSPRAMAGKSIFSFVFDAGRESQPYDLMILRDEFAKLGDRVLETRLRFASKQGEPVDLLLRLERIGSIGTESEAVVLGKAVLRAEDVLLSAVVTEHGRYAIENFLNLSELVHERITRSLGRYFESEVRDDISLVLREMLINAIEHGNLEISYSEKTQAQANGTYMDLIRERQKLLPHRRVFVEYSLNARRIWFRITDEGKGFDHRSMEGSEKERLRDMSASHGRGIALARALFDVVRYNETGNSVVLVKGTHAVGMQ
jgi:PAS domain S-box-containing protein